MELNDFIAKFAEQFDETDASEITAECNYKDLDEWSSLISMSIIAFVKSEYGKTVTGTDIRTCNTVAELFHLIKTK